MRIKVVLFSIVMLLVAGLGNARMMAPSKTKCFVLDNATKEATITIKYYPNNVTMGEISVLEKAGNSDELVSFNISSAKTNVYKVKFVQNAPRFEPKMSWSKSTQFILSKDKSGNEILKVKILKYSSKTKKYSVMYRTFKSCPKN